MADKGIIYIVKSIGPRTEPYVEIVLHPTALSYIYIYIKQKYKA